MPGIDRVDAAAAIPTIVAQEALKALTRYSSMAALVSRDYDTQVAQYGEAVKIFDPGSITVQDKVRDTDLTFADVAGTGATVTLNQHKVAAIKIEDVARALARPDLLAAYGARGAVALREAIDDSLLALATDASVTQQVGAAGTAPTRNTILDARNMLNAAKAPRDGRSLVLSSDAETALWKDASVNPWNNQFASSDNGQAPNQFGFSLYVNQGVTTTAGTPNRVNNLAFHRDGLVLATRPLAAPAVPNVAASTVAADGMVLRVMSSYDHKAMAYIITLDLLYGVAVLRANQVVRVAS